MFPRIPASKLISVLVLAFLCLNVGGALCLTYCSQVMAAEPEAAHLSEHCRRAKEKAEELESQKTKLVADEASCCMMPVAMPAAPIEKQARIAPIDVSAAVAAASEFHYTPQRLDTAAAVSVPVYRPPPLDHRFERLLHSVIRI